MSFKSLGLSEEIVRAVTERGYTEPTPIQAQAIPVVLQGGDLLGGAQTGTGKTAGFTLPMLQRLMAKPVNGKAFIRALVLTPTRELAAQVEESVRLYGKYLPLKSMMMFGGVNINPQIKQLHGRVDVLVATPGRLLDHVQQKTVDLSHIEILVLDEADRMLDMGFYDDIAFVVKRCPTQRQTLLFSATYPEGIVRLARQFMQQPQEVKLAEQHAGSKIRQRFYEIKHDERLQAVATLLKHYRPVSTLAFCNTKQQCRDLLDVLHQHGITALTLNGDLEQRERDQVLIQFANRSCSVLVATDVAARGLDITQLEAVINVDVTPDPEIHIHRIGRTGRADEDGWALSLCSPADMHRVSNIAKMVGSEPEWHTLGSLQGGNDAPLVPPMVTLQILGGRKEKIRPGDVLGALTGEAGFTREQVGKITVTDQSTYVAVTRDIAREAVRRLSAGKVKGKTVKVRAL
jgi:ATP-dependent RNA helicase DbpA